MVTKILNFLLLLFANLFVFFAADVKELDYLRALDDSISYRLVFKPFDEFPEHLVGSGLGSATQQQQQQKSETDDTAEKSSRSTSSRVVTIVSADSEQYQCVLPVLAPSSKKRIESYHGPGPAELLQSIYNEQICSYRIEPYWSYELCHGRYVLQYHEDKETKQRTEYFLGNFASTAVEAEAKTFDQLNPPTRKVGDDRLAYYPVTYIHGTVCDLTGKPRQTTVLYVCDEEARQNVHSISEVSSCHYEMIVLSSEVCAHPSFQRPSTNEYEVKCYPTVPPVEEVEGEEGQEPDPKPKALQALEAEQREEFLNEFALYKTSSPALSAKNIFTKILKVDEGVIEEGFNQLNAILEAIKKSSQQQQTQGAGTGTGPEGSSAPQSPPKSSEGQLLVDRFWRGEVCLQGGTGWWKHEVCMGRTVSQYHEDAAGERQTIVLGRFDEAVHKAWATEHPEKAVERKVDGTVLMVAHMYTQGDICPETGAHRDCQVRIRCRDDITAQKVFIYMLEPTKCSYVVVLESALFCPKLQSVDALGMFPAMAAGDADPQQHEQQVPAEKVATKRKFSAAGTVELDLMNQEEILRIVQQLLDGAGGDGDGDQPQQQHILISAAKLKIGGKKIMEKEEGEGEGETVREEEESAETGEGSETVRGEETEGRGGLAIGHPEPVEQYQKQQQGEEKQRREEKQQKKGEL